MSHSDLQVEPPDIIPQFVYDELPMFLRKSSEIFKDFRERDIYLTGVLSVLGGAFHNVTAYNESEKYEVSLNLFSFIVAPPASGKGVLNYSKRIADRIRETFAKKESNKSSEIPSSLFMPANISSSGLAQLLNKNDGVGIMVESEIDTLLIANKQEWGNYSDILRKSFENESYSLYRKVEKEYLNINKLKLSFAMSGTADQFKNLMVSAENGLFSRGCYYVFDNDDRPLQFIGRIDSSQDIDSYFAGFASIANDYYEKLLKFKNIRIIFNLKQLTELQNQMIFVQGEWATEKDLEATIKRAYTITLKIASILACLSACETDSLSESFYCSDEIFETSISLIFIYLIHADNAYSLISKRRFFKLKPNHQNVLDRLPNTFTKPEAVQIGIEMNIPQRTIYAILTSLEKKEALKVENGKYIKTT